MLKSPCINVCRMDAGSGLCTGCWRTLAEITAWSRSDESTQSEILRLVAQRRQQGLAASRHEPTTSP